MKKAASLFFVSAMLAALPLTAQTPQPDDQELLALVNELTANQAQLLDNQGKIEAKVADVAETIRVARIFVKRAGGPHKPPP